MSESPRSSAVTSADRASEQLAQLDNDREQLQRRTATPRWVAPILAVVAGAFVASPGVARNDWGTIHFLNSLITVLVVMEIARRQSGRKGGASGPMTWALYATLLVVLLGSLSVSLGLVSLGHHWWVALPTLGAAGATYLILRTLERHTAEKIQR